MIVLVTGGRDYWDWDTVCHTLDLIGPTFVVCQDGPGAGAEAYYWAERREVKHAFESKIAMLEDIRVKFSKHHIEVT